MGCCSSQPLPAPPHGTCIHAPDIDPDVPLRTVCEIELESAERLFASPDQQLSHLQSLFHCALQPVSATHMPNELLFIIAEYAEESSLNNLELFPHFTCPPLQLFRCRLQTSDMSPSADVCDMQWIVASSFESCCRWLQSHNPALSVGYMAAAPNSQWTPLAGIGYTLANMRQWMIQYPHAEDGSDWFRLGYKRRIAEATRLQQINREYTVVEVERHLFFQILEAERAPNSPASLMSVFLLTSTPLFTPLVDCSRFYRFIRAESVVAAWCFVLQQVAIGSADFAFLDADKLARCIGRKGRQQLLDSPPLPSELTSLMHATRMSSGGPSQRLFSPTIVAWSAIHVERCHVAVEQGMH